MITDRERSDARSDLGKLLRPLIQSRPDLAFFVAHAVGSISQFTVNNLLLINKLNRRLQFETKKPLLFPDLGGSHLWRLVCFTDVSFSNNSDGSTQGIFFSVFDKYQNKKSISFVVEELQTPKNCSKHTVRRDIGLHRGIRQLYFISKHRYRNR